MKTRFVFILAAGLALLFSACSKEDPATDLMDLELKSSETAAFLCDNCTYDGVLTEDDSLGLLFMREEEKLAGDVYKTFFEAYGETIFQNIANSEDAHTSAVLNLINAYGLEDPALEDRGEFSNPDLAELYASLVDEGTSLGAALKVGALIEEIDILDLIEELERTENEDLQRVYGNLLSGSENHLRAFVNALAGIGVTYEPQELETADYQAILDGQNANMGKGKGQNNSSNNGAGNGNKGSNGQNGTGTGTNGSGTGVCDGTQTGSNNVNQNGGSGTKGNSNGKGK